MEEHAAHTSLRLTWALTQRPIHLIPSKQPIRLRLITDWVEAISAAPAQATTAISHLLIPHHPPQEVRRITNRMANTLVTSATTTF